MEKLAMDAFKKLQKQEHLLRNAIDRRGLRKITHAQFREEEKAILERFALTEEEKRAYEYYNRVVAQRKRG